MCCKRSPVPIRCDPLPPSLTEQNILERGEGAMAQLVTDDQGVDDDDDADVRRKLRRLTGVGGALESEAIRSSHLFAPKGALAETADAALKEVTNAAELERIAAEGVDDLSEVFSRATELAGASKGGAAASEMLRDRGDTEGRSVDDDWGSFDEEDWRGSGRGEGEHGGKSTEVSRPRGAGIREEVPGLLGGARFVRENGEEGREEEEEGGGDGAVEEAMP